MPRRFHDLAELQREDARAAEAHQQRHGWFWRQLHVWTERFERLGAFTKALGAFLVAAGAVLGVGYKLVKFVGDRRVAAAELPAPTGIASTAVDRVEKPPTSPPQSSVSQLSK
jgi:hypothetical protein